MFKNINIFSVNDWRRKTKIQNLVLLLVSKRTAPKQTMKKSYYKAIYSTVYQIGWIVYLREPLEDIT